MSTPTTDTSKKQRERSADELSTIADIQKLIDEMIIAQDKSDDGNGRPLSDAKFARHLGFSGPKWGLMKRGEYFDMIDNASKLLNDFRRQVNSYKNSKRHSERFGDLTYIPLEPFKAIYAAVEQCTNKPLSDPKRNIVYLAPPGGGKTFLGNQLAERFSAVCVDSRKSWRNSDFYALQDLCQKFELKMPKGFASAALQDLLFDELKETNPVLFIDEAEYFGADVINMFKFFLNNTKIVTVIATVPESYERWNTYWKLEADQFRRRTHLVVRHNTISADVAAKFLSPLSLGEHAERAAQLLSDAANVFGAYDIMSCVVERLKRQSNITPAKITNAITIEYEKMGFDGIPKKGGK